MRVDPVRPLRDIGLTRLVVAFDAAEPTVSLTHALDLLHSRQICVGREVEPRGALRSGWKREPLPCRIDLDSIDEEILRVRIWNAGIEAAPRQRYRDIAQPRRDGRALHEPGERHAGGLLEDLEADWKPIDCVERADQKVRGIGERGVRLGHRHILGGDGQDDHCGSEGQGVVRAQSANTVSRDAPAPTNLRQPLDSMPRRALAMWGVPASGVRGHSRSDPTPGRRRECPRLREP